MASVALRPAIEGILERDDKGWCGDAGCLVASGQALDRALDRAAGGLRRRPVQVAMGRGAPRAVGAPAAGNVAALARFFDVRVPTGGDGFTVNVAQFHANRPKEPFASRHAPRCERYTTSRTSNSRASSTRPGRAAWCSRRATADMSAAWADVAYRPLQLDAAGHAAPPAADALSPPVPAVAAEQPRRCRPGQRPEVGFLDARVGEQLGAACPASRRVRSRARRRGRRASATTATFCSTSSTVMPSLVQAPDGLQHLLHDGRRQAQRRLVEHDQLAARPSGSGRSPASAARRPTGCRPPAPIAPAGAGTSRTPPPASAPRRRARAAAARRPRGSPARVRVGNTWRPSATWPMPRLQVTVAGQARDLAARRSGSCRRAATPCRRWCGSARSCRRRWRRRWRRSRPARMSIETPASACASP